MKNNSSQIQSKKRNIFFKSYNDFDLFNGKKDKVISKTNSVNNFFNSFFSHQQKYHLKKGQLPILSTNKRIILIIENNYEKKLQKGKSPFFISNKLNFKTAFKDKKMKNNKKVKHLGICDYYTKFKDTKLMNDKDNNENESDDSKTPRFHKD